MKSKVWIQKTKLSSFKSIDTLGKGAFGEVKSYNTGKRVVAIKKISMKEGRGVPLTLLMELDMMRKFSSLNSVVDIYGISMDSIRKTGDRFGYIIMEKLDTDLMNWLLRTNFKNRMSELHSIIRRVGGTLAVMHRYGIVHNDFKNNNVLISFSRDGMRYKLTDFGKSRYVDSRYMYYDGLEIDSPPYTCDVFHSEYYAFVVNMIKVIDHDRIISGKKEDFYNKYRMKEGICKQLFKGVKTDFIDFPLYLSEILSSDEYNAIPDFFWKFITPLVLDKESTIEDGLREIGIGLSKEVLDMVNGSIAKVRTDNSSPLINLRMKEWYKRLVKYLIKRRPDLTEEKLDKCKEAIKFLLCDNSKDCLKNFKSNEELEEYQLRILDVIDFQISPIPYI